MTDISLGFEGPFTFVEGKRSLFHSRHAKSEGVYLWAFQQKHDGSHLIHYVGETVSFAKRHREHLIHILSMDYGIFDPDDAAAGQCTLVWQGLWRDKSPNGPGRLLSKYSHLTNLVQQYVAALSVFFAPTQLESRLRKHVEGCIGWNLRNNHQESQVLYPDDNHVGARGEKGSGILQISCDSNIRGLDSSIPY